MVRYRSGDITKDDADILICTVNCVGVMGKGVALDFKTAFPEIEREYVDACRRVIVRPGTCVLYPFTVVRPNRYWGAFATKDHWRYPSKYEWIERGLRDLKFGAYVLHCESIAIPPLGCGNGKLEWSKVRPMIIDNLSMFDLRIYGSEE